MKREEYLNKLKLTLEGHDFAQVEEAIGYFDELLQDRMTDEGLQEEEAVAGMEAPEDIAAKLREERRKEQQTGTKAEPAGEQPLSGIKTIRVRADQVRSIRVRDRNTRLTVRGAEGEDIVIRHPETEKIRYTFSLENGRLSLLRDPIDFASIMFSLDFLSREMREVSVEVPRELAAELDLRTSNAKLELEGFNCWGQAMAATSNTSLTARNLQAKRLELASSNGSLALQGLRVQQDLRAATSNARITAEGVSAPQSLTLKTSNGSISVSKLDSREISLTTSNSSVKGTLPGKLEDYAVKASTSNGKNSLPRERAGGDKALTVHTSNGSISLGFMESS